MWGGGGGAAGGQKYRELLISAPTDSLEAGMGMEGVFCVLIHDTGEIM